LKPFDLIKIEKETYAFLLARFLSQFREIPRFVLLGFEDIREELRSQFNERYEEGRFVEPEEKGQLNTAFSEREKSGSICIIALRHESIGKYASLLTSFKVLNESFSLEPRKFIQTLTLGDVYDPIDVTKWFIGTTKNVEEICTYIKEKLHLTSCPQYELLTVVLKEMVKLAESRPSYAGCVHPRKILRGLVKAMNTTRDLSVGFLLKEIGIEPTKEVNEIFLFSQPSDATIASMKEKIKKVCDSNARALEKYFSCEIRKQKRNLAALSMNLMEKMLYHLANAGIRKKYKRAQRWIRDFYEFEKKIEKTSESGRRYYRKYKTNSVGTAILERSQVSGLPTRVKFVLTRSEKSGRNLLKDFFVEKELERLMDEHHKLVGELGYNIIPISMINDDELTLELSLKGDNILDAIVEGFKKITPKVNDLLLEIERGGYIYDH
jgi:hypothetical protein